MVSSSHSHEINKDKIETIIKDFLIKNPDFIKSTLDDYKISLENKKIIESVEVLTLVTLFLSSIYAVAPVV